jgi:hypothetical protein
MGKAPETIFGQQGSFIKARRRALTRLRDGMDLRWCPARSREDLYRSFGDSTVDPGGAQSPLDLTRPGGSIGDERE